MSLLDTASLIVTPNGYKEGKLYSVIPSDGSGDLSVTRATTATRVNSQGLVELVPYNLVEYSEQLNNAYWSTQDATITANSTTAPNGTLTADTFTRTSNTGFLYSTNPLALIDGSYSISVYAKANTASSFRLDLGTAGLGQGVTCFFNLSNGTASTPTVYGSTTSIATSIENVGNGWYRCSLSVNIIAANYYAELAITTTGSIYAWGFQLVEGSVAKDYQKTETRLNIPRLDYSNGTCPSILVEPQRTNISQYVESGSAGFNAATITNATSIVGLKTFKVTNNISGFGDAPYIFSNIEYQANTPYTLSFYTDFNECTGATISCSFLGFFPSLSYTGIIVNKTTKAVQTFLTGSAWTLNNYEVTQISGEVYKIEITATPNAAGSSSRNYIGSDANTSAMVVAGVQLEAGSYATSYIQKTTGASVTRNADVISKTGISSLIGQTEGTIFCELDRIDGAENMGIWMRTGGTPYNEIITILVSQFGVCSVYVRSSSSDQFVASSSALSLGKHKFALAYKANDFAFYIDGVQIATSTSGTPPTCDQVYLGGYPDGGARASKNVATALWKTRLTNAQLATLTTI